MKIAFNLYHREGPWCLRLLPAGVDLRGKTVGMFDALWANAIVVYDLNSLDLADMVSRATKVRFVVVECDLPCGCCASAHIFRSRAEAESWIKADAGELDCANISDAEDAGLRNIVIGRLIRLDNDRYEIYHGSESNYCRSGYTMILETEVELIDVLAAIGMQKQSLKFELYNGNYTKTGPRFHWYPFGDGPAIIPLRSHAEILKVITDTLEGKAGPHKLICYVSGEDCEANAHALVDALKIKLPEFSVAIGQGKGEWAVVIERGTLDEGIAF